MAEAFDARKDLEAFRVELEAWAASGLSADIDPVRDAVTLADPVNVAACKLIRTVTRALQALRESEADRERRLEEMKLRGRGSAQSSLF